MRSLALTALLLAAAAAVPAAADAATSASHCRDLIPNRTTPPPRRPLVPEDLVRLRDIGPVDPAGHTAPFFSISPDGGRVAFQLRRADPAANSYCLGMVVMDLAGGSAPAIVDTGGDLLLLAIEIRGKADFPTGIPIVVTPRWSPDGTWIAFLKRSGGRIQVWRAAADGSGSAPLTRSSSDVADFRIAPDGASLVYTSREPLDRARDAIERESLVGFHYDDRFAPVASNRPFPLAPVGLETHVLELATGNVRAATAAEAAWVASTSHPQAGPSATRAVAHKQEVWISGTTLGGGARPGALHARRGDGSAVTCPARECTGASKPWRMADARRVRFFRLEGWSEASTALYEWNMATGAVRRLYLTDDLLADCTPAGESLICLREGSLQPRRLERLDPDSGKRQLLFDPNPEFAELQLGRAERLHWRNSFGLEVIGDLVLPVGYRKGRPYPLVVVQYKTRGFLRGGTGDEYPIQAFANRGYAVLSVGSPDAIGALRGARDFQEGNRLNLIGFAERRSGLSAVEVGVRLAIARGIADPERIGISGLSNGATTTIHALLHSKLFSAAAMSSCCMDTTLPARVGPAAARAFHATGYPKMTDHNEAFWREISLSLNARRIAIPILLQLSDDESMSALESYTALREVGAPVDMFIFPGEHHVKWQPAHRLAVFRRSLDWFDFWLRGVRSRDPDRQTELRHWDSLREGPAPGSRLSRALAP